MVVSACNPSIWEAETDGAQGLADSQSSLTDDLQASERPCLRANGRWMAPEERQRVCYLACTHIYIQTEPHTRMHK